MTKRRINNVFFFFFCSIFFLQSSRLPPSKTYRLVGVASFEESGEIEPCAGMLRVKLLLLRRRLLLLLLVKMIG